jgi:hypothetical protein
VFSTVDAKGDLIPEGDGTEEIPEWMRGRE